LGGIYTNVHLAIVVSLKAHEHAKNSVECQHHFSPE
jgi:hypothetical protein